MHRHSYAPSFLSAYPGMGYPARFDGWVAIYCSCLPFLVWLNFVTIYSIIDWWPVFQPRLPNLMNVGEPPKHFQRYRLIRLSMWMCPIFFLVRERNSMSSLFLKRTQEDQGLALKGLNPWEQMCAGPRTDVCPTVTGTRSVPNHS